MDTVLCRVPPTAVECEHLTSTCPADCCFVLSILYPPRSICFAGLRKALGYVAQASKESASDKDEFDTLSEKDREKAEKRALEEMDPGAHDPMDIYADTPVYSEGRDQADGGCEDLEFDVCMSQSGCHWEKTQCARMPHLDAPNKKNHVQMKDAGDAIDAALPIDLDPSLDVGYGGERAQVHAQENAGQENAQENAQENGIRKVKTPRAPYIQPDDRRTKTGDDVILVLGVAVVGCMLWFVFNKKQAESARLAAKQT